MRKPTRLFIAIVELCGGVFLMIASVFSKLTHVQFPGWYLAFTESLGVITVIAALRLIQNRTEGLTISLFLQAAQIVQVFLPNVLYRVVLGPYLVIILSADSTLISPGFMGELTIGWKGPDSPAIGVNVVAAVLFFLLARSIVGQRKRVIPTAIGSHPRS
jgi:hypothetical protein